MTSRLKTAGVLVMMSLALHLPVSAAPFAGSGAIGADDGTAVSATFSSPWGVATDASGAVFVADTLNNTIRKLENGKVTTFAGSSATMTGADGLPAGMWKDGPMLQARFSQPRALAAFGGSLVVADSGSNTLRLMRNGQVYTLAGTSAPGFRDGTGSQAAFSKPSGVAVASDGAVYVADTLNHAVRKVTQEGVVTTVAGSGKAGCQDGPAGQALFREPQGIAVDAHGTLWIADAGNQRIRKIENGIVSTVAGSGVPDSDTGRYPGGYDDGAALSARFSAPRGLTVTAEGNLIIADNKNKAVRILTAAGVRTLVQGVESPSGVAVSGDTLYVTDNWTHQVQKYSIREAMASMPADVHQVRESDMVFHPGAEQQIWMNRSEPDFHEAGFFIEDGRTWVPARYAVEAMGGSAEWKDQSVVLTWKGKVVTLAAGDPSLQFRKDRSFLKLRDLCGLFGWQLEWVEAYRAVVVSAP